MTITRNLTQPLTRAITNAITQAGAGGGYETEQFMVTDNGGEPFQVDDESANPIDFLVRA